MKKKLYTEIAYILGLVILALGSALVAASNFGVAMVVAPAYLIYLKLSSLPALSFFTFGMAEMLFQIVIFILMLIVLRKFKVRYLFFFVTTLFYGLVLLDSFMRLIALIPGGELLYVRIIYFVIGLLLSALGVAFLFHTYITPEAYELFVMEVSKKYNFNINRFKTIYDISSCVLAVIMSLLLFQLGELKSIRSGSDFLNILKGLQGVGIGTVIAAVLNGFIISLFSKFLEKRLHFVHRFKRLAPPAVSSNNDEPIEPDDE